MTLSHLLAWARDKTRFQCVCDYSDFCEEYLSFISGGLQAVIVSQNEQHYRFFQYREDGGFKEPLIQSPHTSCRKVFSPICAR